jgi:thioester reductase-like protein
MNKRTAIIFGATGLIGNLLLEELLRSEEYLTIKIFIRQPVEISIIKLKNL